MRIKKNWFIGPIVILLFQASVANAEKIPQAAQVGDTYEITLQRHSVQQSSNGSSGSSRDKDTIIEQVTDVRADGLELQYDLPNSATTDEKARTWQFPVRVFKRTDGQMQLHNSVELEARLEGWLNAAKLPRTACGHWIFTWTAFRIECDPQSVINTLQSFDLGPASPREGELYQDSEAGSSGKLARRSSGLGGETFTVEMSVDAAAVRRARAESDVVLGEIMKEPVSLGSALQKRAGEVVSGTISVTIDADPTGIVRRRNKVTTVNTKGLDGHSETQTITETLERRRISPRD